MPISEIALAGALVLLSVSLLLIGIFGLKNIVAGKHEWQKIVIILLPAAIFGVTFGITNQLTESALVTLVSLIGLMLLMIFISGVRSSFKI